MDEADIEALPYRPCVGVVLTNRDGWVFAGQRIDNPGPAWQMPQGGIDAGEKPKMAALRELHEETGVPADAVEVVAKSRTWVTYDLPQELVGKLWKGRYRGQRQRWFLMRLTGSESVIHIDTEHAEFSRWSWLTPDDLLERIVPFKRAVYETVFDEFRPLLATRRTAQSGLGAER